MVRSVAPATPEAHGSKDCDEGRPNASSGLSSHCALLARHQADRRTRPPGRSAASYHLLAGPGRGLRGWRPENPRVGGSIPSLATISFLRPLPSTPEEQLAVNLVACIARPW